MLRLYHRLFRCLLRHAEMVTDHKQNSWAVLAVCEQSFQMSGVQLWLVCLFMDCSALSLSAYWAALKIHI